MEKALSSWELCLPHLPFYPVEKDNNYGSYQEEKHAVAVSERQHVQLQNLQDIENFRKLKSLCNFLLHLKSVRRTAGGLSTFLYFNF